MKVGDILIAIDECKMEDTNDNALIIGKHYPIVEIDAKNVYIESEIANLHSFKIKTLSEFFKQGKPENQETLKECVLGRSDFNKVYLKNNSCFKIGYFILENIFDRSYQWWRIELPKEYKEITF